MIRKANVNDAEEIAKILVYSWQVNFKGIVPENYLNQMDTVKISKGIEKSIEENSLFVAEIDGTIVAFAGCGLNRLQDHPEFDSELHAIHVLPNKKGKGIGKDLFKIVKMNLSEQGYKNMILSVFEENTAKNFYEKLGGTFVDCRTVEYGGKKCIERLYGWNFS